MNPSKAAAISLCVASAFVGFLIAVVTAFYIPTRPPVGVVATVLLLGPYAHLVGRALRSSAAATIPAVSWLTTTMFVAGNRREGDVVIAANLRGIAFLLLGTVAGAVGIGTVRAGVARDERRREERAAAEAAAQAAAEAAAPAP